MGIYLETRPIDLKAAYIHEQIPEFRQIPPKETLVVREGNLVIGTIANKFRSDGFDLCSAIAIKDPFEATFGFFHAFPGQELTDEDIETLVPLQRGFACLIQGSHSTDKRRLLRNLHTILDIEHTDTIAVDTRTVNHKSLCFHTAWRPAENQVLIARISHRDVLTFPAFRT